MLPIYTSLPLFLLNGFQRFSHNDQNIFGSEPPVWNSFGNRAPVLPMMRLGQHAPLHNTLLLSLDEEKKLINNKIKIWETKKSDIFRE